MENTFCRGELKDIKKAKKLLQQVLNFNRYRNRDTQALWQIISRLTELLERNK